MPSSSRMRVTCVWTVRSETIGRAAPRGGMMDCYATLAATAARHPEMEAEGHVDARDTTSSVSRRHLRTADLTVRPRPAPPGGCRGHGVPAGPRRGGFGPEQLRPI